MPDNGLVDNTPDIERALATSLRDGTAVRTHLTRKVPSVILGVVVAMEACRWVELDQPGTRTNVPWKFIASVELDAS